MELLNSAWFILLKHTKNYFSVYLSMTFRTWPLKKSWQMKYEDVLILNLMLNHDRRFLFHAANALQALCSSSGSEALLFLSIRYLDFSHQNPTNWLSQPCRDFILSLTYSLLKAPVYFVSERVLIANPRFLFWGCTLRLLAFYAFLTCMQLNITWKGL